MEWDKLTAEFPKEAISWRAQTVYEGKALALAYIDARDVMDRLDEVCGPPNWQCKYSHANGKTVCDIAINTFAGLMKEDGNGGYITVEPVWVWKADGAGDSDIEAEKGALSDAFKRAAVRWGIGRYLYSLKSPWVPCELGNNGKFKRFTDDPWKYVKGEKPEAKSVFKNSAERNDFCRKVKESMSGSKNTVELSLVLSHCDKRLREMDSGNGFDIQGATDIRSHESVMRERLATPFEDWIEDIANAPTLEGLKFKFDEASQLFKTNPDALAQIIEAKDIRKASLPATTMFKKKVSA